MPTALVTGASRNIGRAIALGLARSGYSVGILTRTDQEAAQRVATEIPHAHVVLADVRNRAEVNAAVDEVTNTLGPIDVLVNNAAVRREQSFDEITTEDWHEVLGVILDGAFHCSAAVLPTMVHRGTGRIVNIAGVTGQTGAALRAHVVTAKAGIIGLTKALALEYAASGVTVNAVSPGMIDTARTHVPHHHKGTSIPVGRRGTPEEVAAAVQYLASPEAAFVTGQTINVNGGLHLS